MVDAFDGDDWPLLHLDAPMVRQDLKNNHLARLMFTAHPIRKGKAKMEYSEIGIKENLRYHAR